MPAVSRAVILLGLWAGSLGSPFAMAAWADETTATDADIGVAEINLDRIILSTGGVGVFSYGADVTGATRLTLPIRVDQVDDVLKSLVISDPGGFDPVVSLPVRAPLDEIFKGLPFSPGDLSSTPHLLQALIGAEVAVSGPEAMRGRVLSVVAETIRTGDDGDLRLGHRLTLATEDGLRQLLVEDVDRLSFTDPEVTASLDQAISALADLRDESRRTLTIDLRTPLTGAVEDPESRRVSLSHLVEVPLWKASYRLTLPATTILPPEAEGPESWSGGHLSGWAILENLSGQDWQNVTVSVIAGDPVTFRQDLYSPYFIDRPSLPVDVSGRILPKADTGTLGVDAMAPPSPRNRLGGGAAALEESEAIADAPMALSAAPMAAPFQNRTQSTGSAVAVQPATAVRDALQAQTLFTLPQPVTLANGHTLLVPLTDDSPEIKRLSLYDPNTQDRHPLAAVSVRNDGRTALPPGAVTLYEQTAGSSVAHLGDAQLKGLPAGEERILVFAVDGAMQVDREIGQQRQLAGLSAANGILTLRDVDRQRTTYTIRGAADADRHLVIDHPRYPGWTITLEGADGGDPPTVSQDQTTSAHRLSLDIPAGETVVLVVRAEQPRRQQLAMGQITGGILTRLTGVETLSQAEQDAVQQLAEFSAELNTYEQSLTRLEQERGQITTDQGRLRDNLGAVPENSDLHTRYLQQLSSLEDRLEGIDQRIAQARTGAESARAKLQSFMATLQLP